MRCSQSQKSDFGPDFPPVFKNQRPVGFPLSPIYIVAKDTRVEVRLRFEFQLGHSNKTDKIRHRLY